MPRFYRPPQATKPVRNGPRGLIGRCKCWVLPSNPKAYSTAINPMPTPTANDLDKILQEALRLKAAVGKIAKLMDAQLEAIESKDLDTLQAIIGQKQTFIDQLLAFSTVKATYELYRTSFPHQVPENLTLAYAELEDNIKSLVNDDQKAIQLLKEHHAEMAGRLQLLMRDRQASGPYSQPVQHPPKPRIDISG